MSIANDKKIIELVERVARLEGDTVSLSREMKQVKSDLHDINRKLDDIFSLLNKGKGIGWILIPAGSLIVVTLSAWINHLFSK